MNKAILLQLAQIEQQFGFQGVGPFPTQEAPASSSSQKQVLAHLSFIQSRCGDVSMGLAGEAPELQSAGKSMENQQVLPSISTAADNGKASSAGAT